MRENEARGCTGTWLHTTYARDPLPSQVLAWRSYAVHFQVRVCAHALSLRVMVIKLA
jgi:hypothetical protein